MDIIRFTQDTFGKIPLFSRLLSLDQIPEHVYTRGSLPDITYDSLGRASPRILTVVGSRDHSSYGEDVLSYLIESLKGQPVIILSGLALGIDSLAHKEALKHGLLTISLPGSGLEEDVLYPRSSVQLSQEILRANGALLSEFPPETRSAKWMFLARNRLMAALSDAILIIEAREKSGTLVTARHGLELGKSIGCVTGSFFSHFNKGSNALIRDGALPIMDKEDLFSLLSLEKKEEQTIPLPLLTKEEKILLSLLKESRHKSDLFSQSGLSPAIFLQTLTSLELQGLVISSLHEVRKLV